MSFNKLSIRDLSLKNKRVLMRVDFNVPFENEAISDDTRIRAALPSISFALEHGAKLILMSHLGRPDGRPDPKYSLMPVAKKLSELLGRTVDFATDCIGKVAKDAVSKLTPGSILLLENVRFHPEEELLDKYKKQDEATKARIDAFVEELASLGDIYVNDAFGTAHRAHASTAGVNRFFKERAAGFLMEREIQYLGGAVANPERPFVAILGGAKVSDKIGVINNLLNKVDTIIIGGAMAYTFLKAQGIAVGTSKVEDEHLDLARELLKLSKDRGIRLALPVDHAVSQSFSASEPEEIVTTIGENQMALDIGPISIDEFSSIIRNAKTVVWNGPMGVFEKPGFARGTMAIAKALADSGVTSIVGGGDSVAAINASGVADKITHISTGGGASLEFLEGKVLPGVVGLSDK